VTALAPSPALPALSLRRPARPRPAARTTRLESATVVRHLDAMYRFALALSGSHHDAQDAVQDACVRVLSRPRDLAPGRERGYLFVAVRHAWVDRVRHRATRPQETGIDDHAHGLVSTGPAPDELLDARRVYAAIAQLADPYRQVVAAVDVAGLSYAEAAELVDVPIGTIMSRLHRGRSRVAASLRAA
jgi:RNA polymerase sigma-70 factor, ECF subfamily